MVLNTQFLVAGDDHSIPVCHWPCDNPRGVLLILHGMAEHASRYDQLAHTLHQQGYGVMALDHRGHGPQTPPQDRGWFAQERGWDKVLEDVSTTYDHLQHHYPNTPVFLLGHSMGSFIAQSWVIQHHPASLNGVILSGSTYNSKVLLLTGRLLAWLEKTIRGSKGKSPVIDMLTFGSYNSAFKPNRTRFDWLSRDAEAVNQYVADPCCGFLCSNGLWFDLFRALLSISSVSALKEINSQLPFYLTGGEQDPVGRFGKGLRQLKETMHRAGIRNVTLALWPGARHEVLHETSYEQVSACLLKWLDQQVPANPPQTYRPQQRKQVKTTIDRG